MNEIKEELILNAISKLNEKVDAITNKFAINTNENRLDGETLSVITAAIYCLFGKRVAVRSVKIVKK